MTIFRDPHHKLKAITFENLYDYLADAKHLHMIVETVACVYEFDAPWTWHMERALKHAGVKVEHFRNKIWAKDFVTGYIKAIQAAEVLLVQTTGVKVGM